MFCSTFGGGGGRRRRRLESNGLTVFSLFCRYVRWDLIPLAECCADGQWAACHQKLVAFVDGIPVGDVVCAPCEAKDNADTKGCNRSATFEAGDNTVKTEDDTKCVNCADGYYKSSATVCTATWTVSLTTATTSPTTTSPTTTQSRTPATSHTTTRTTAAGEIEADKPWKNATTKAAHCVLYPDAPLCTRTTAGTTTTTLSSSAGGGGNKAPEDQTGSIISPQYVALLCTAIVVLGLCTVMGTHFKIKHGSSTTSMNWGRSALLKSRRAAPDYARFDNLVFDATNAIHGSALRKPGALDDLLDLQHHREYVSGVEGHAHGHGHGGLRDPSGGHTRAAYGMGATYSLEAQASSRSADDFAEQQSQCTPATHVLAQHVLSTEPQGETGWLMCLPPLPDLDDSMSLPVGDFMSPSPCQAWNTSASTVCGTPHAKAEPGMQVQMQMQMQMKQEPVRTMDFGLGHAPVAGGVLQAAHPLGLLPMPTVGDAFQPGYAHVVDLNDIFGSDEPEAPQSPDMVDLNDIFLRDEPDQAPPCPN